MLFIVIQSMTFEASDYSRFLPLAQMNFLGSERQVSTSPCPSSPCPLSVQYFLSDIGTHVSILFSVVLSSFSLHSQHFSHVLHLSSSHACTSSIVILLEACATLNIFTNAYHVSVPGLLRLLWVIPCQINQWFASHSSDFDEIWHTCR